MRLFFFLISFCITAQNNLHVKEIDSLMIEYDELFVLMKENIDTSFLTNLTKETGNWNQFYDSSMNLVDTLASQKEKNIPSVNLGLNWHTETNHNFRPGISETEHFTYKTRLSSGLDWNLIGEGSYFRNKKYQEILYKEYEIDQLQRNMAERELQLSEKMNFVDEIFDYYRLSLYLRFETFYEKKLEFSRNLYRLKLINQVALVQAENEYKNIQNKIRLFSLSKSSEFLKDFDRVPDLLQDDPELPDWESIDFDGLMELEKEELALSRDILLASSKSARSPRLRLKARYNYYTIYNNDRGYGSIGASLNIPIEFKSNSEWRADLMVDKKEYDFSHKKENLKQRLHSDYRRFYQLKNKKLELLNNLIYVEEYLQNETSVFKDFKQNFSPTNYIEKSVESIKIQEELIDVQHQLLKIYLQFLFKIRHSPDLTSKILGVGMKNIFSKKSTYLWKNEFTDIDNENLLSLLKKNEISTLYLSPGESSDKLNDFLKLSKSNNLDVARLIGENSYVSSENGKENLLRKLKESKDRGFSHIHLDIEPQQFSDYKLRRSIYDQKLAELFAAAIEWSKDNAIELSVSVPMNLDVKIAELLIRNQIEVNVMAYEQKDQSKLFIRTKELRNILGDFMVWVIRLQDFSVAEFEVALDAIAEKGITKIGFYKLIDLPNQI